MGLVETEALILRNLRLGEADKIVVVLTRREGVVRGVARGALRLKSKFGASLEPFTLIHLTFFEKEARELVTFTQTEIVESYFDLTRDDKIFITLEYLAGLIIEFAPLRAPDERFYRLLRACLQALRETPAEVKRIARYCEIWTLKIAGFLPELSHCASCKQMLSGEAGGGLLDYHNVLKCKRCSDGQGLPVSDLVTRELKVALKSRPEDWTQQTRAHGADGVDAELGNLVRILITRALEREPKFRPGQLAS
ncbi:MAG: DNA repair protein RecO [Pyrinomonadaceae bacterium]